MIVTDEETLRVHCEEVLPEEVQELRERLEAALKWSASKGRPGVGIACPQIGIAKAMAIVRIGDTSIDLVNPKILNKYHQFKFEGEGCLSFPGLQEETLRYNEIVVESAVSPYNFIVTGFGAVVVQHEIDHLNSILLPDVAIEK